MTEKQLLGHWFDGEYKTLRIYRRKAERTRIAPVGGRWFGETDARFLVGFYPTLTRAPAF